MLFRSAFQEGTGRKVWFDKRDDTYRLSIGGTFLQTKRKDIADSWIDKYNMNTTNKEQLDRYTENGIGLVPWGLPLVEDKDQTNWNKKLADMILPPKRHGVQSSRRPIKSDYVICYDNYGETGYVGPGIDGDVGKDIEKAMRFNTYDEAKKEMELLQPEW